MESPHAGRADLSNYDAYDAIDTGIRVILAAAVGILLLQYLGWLVGNNTQNIVLHYMNASATPASWYTLEQNYKFLDPPLVYQFVIVGALWVSSPLWLSLLFSRMRRDTSNVRIVPPLAIAIASGAYGAIFFVGYPFLTQSSEAQSLANETNGLFVFMVFIFFGMAAWGSESITVRVLGRTARRDYIFFEALRVHAGLEEVRTRLSSPEVRLNLALDMRAEGDAKSGYLLTTPFRPDRRYFDFAVRMRLIPERPQPTDPQGQEQTVVKVTYYYKSHYSVRRTPYFEEYVRKQSAYLHELLSTRTPPLPSDTISALAPGSTDIFVDETMDSMRGFLTEVGRAPSTLTYLLIAIAGFAGFAAYLFLINSPSFAVYTSIAVSAVVAIVAVFERFGGGRA